ncbi:MAG: Rossmann-like and DUF2520 domain-containing protein [Sarcina sp.]
MNGTKNSSTFGGDIIKFGFIGASKLGVSLGKYFIENNIKVSGYYNRNNEMAKEAAVFTGTMFFETIEELVKNSSVIFISTADCAIAQMWELLKQYNITGKIICHGSGSISSEIFSNINKFGAYGYSIHPMLAISSKYDSYKLLKNAFITIEGDKKYKYSLYNLFKDIGNDVAFISSNDKAKYHLSAVMASNLIVAQVNKSVQLLSECGFDKNEALKALMPLIENNIKNISKKGVEESLTGPVERGDLGTIKRHVDCFENENDLELYRLLSLGALEIAQEKNNFRNYDEIKDYLEE